MNTARAIARLTLLLALSASLMSAAEERTNTATALRSERAAARKRAAGVPAVHLDPGPMVGHVSSSNALLWARASGAARLGV